MGEPLQIIEVQRQEIDDLFDQVVDPGTDHRSVLSELTAKLAAHISIEHSVVLPVIRAGESGSGAMGRALKQDYRRMGHLLTRIERRKINSPDLPDLLAALQAEWRRHSVRHERLRGIDARLPEEERAELSEKVARAEDVIMSHPHPHLLALGPLSRLTTRLAARFDRARDRTVPNLP